MAEIDEYYPLERKLLYITQCTCQGGVVAERRQSIENCEEKHTGRRLERCIDDAWDTQEKIREDCIDPCMDLAHLHKDAAMLLCKADDMERTEQRACRKTAYSDYKK